MAVPICAASPAGWYGMFSHSLTDAGQLIHRDAALGLSLIVMVSFFRVVNLYRPQPKSPAHCASSSLKSPRLRPSFAH